MQAVQEAMAHHMQDAVDRTPTPQRAPTVAMEEVHTHMKAAQPGTSWTEIEIGIGIEKETETGMSATAAMTRRAVHEVQVRESVVAAMGTRDERWARISLASERMKFLKWYGYLSELNQGWYTEVLVKDVEQRMTEKDELCERDHQCHVSI